MVTGKTSTGFKYSANKKKLQDVRFLKKYKDMVNSGDGTDILDMIPMILGEEQAEKLYEHCDRDGISDIEDVSREFGEIIQQLGAAEETKN